MKYTRPDDLEAVMKRPVITLYVNDPMGKR